MKKVFNIVCFATILAFVGILTQSFTSTVTPSVSNGIKALSETVIVPAGTPVSVRLNGNWNSDDIQDGNIIKLKVSDEVVIDGHVVVAHGAVAEGEITNVKRLNSCETCPSEFQSFELTVTRVKAVSGSFIVVEPTPHLVKGKCPKCPVQVSQGVAMQAHVLSNTTVRLR